MFNIEDKQQRNNFINIVTLIVVIIIGGIVFLFTNRSEEIEVPENNTAFENILSEFRSWSGDFLIQGCSSSVLQTDKKHSWTCNAVSPLKSQSRIAVWTGDEVTISQPVSLNEQFIELINQKPSFNDLDSLVSINEILDSAREIGLDDQTNDVNIFVGESTINLFEDRYVWLVEERSKTERDEDNASVLINSFYFDAKTGEFIE